MQEFRQHAALQRQTALAGQREAAVRHLVNSHDRVLRSDCIWSWRNVVELEKLQRQPPVEELVPEQETPEAGLPERFYRSTFSHPALGPEETQAVLEVQTPTKGRLLLADDRPQVVDIEVDANTGNVVISDEDKKFVGAGDESGAVRGEVIQQGVGGGKFELTPQELDPYTAVIVERMKGSDGQTDYKIRVSQGGSSKMVQHNFSDFQALHDAISGQEVQLQPMPPTSDRWVFFNQAFQETRQQTLNKILAEALGEDPYLLWLSPLRTFLEVGGAPADPATVMPEPVMVQPELLEHMPAPRSDIFDRSIECVADDVW